MRCAALRIDPAERQRRASALALGLREDLHQGHRDLSTWKRLPYLGQLSAGHEQRADDLVQFLCSLSQQVFLDLPRRGFRQVGENDMLRYFEASQVRATEGDK